MYCSVCGANNSDMAAVCISCGSQLDSKAGGYAFVPSGMSQQQSFQLGKGMADYCKVMRVPKLGIVPVIVTVFVMVAVSALITIASGIYVGLFVGAFFGALFAFIVWLGYRLRAGASKRLNSYFAQEGEEAVLSDFAIAESFANDRFRLGRRYLFIRNGAVLKIVNITETVKVMTHRKMLPAGVHLTVLVDDENGSMAFPLCRLSMLKFKTQTDEINNAFMQRCSLAFQEINRR